MTFEYFPNRGIKIDETFFEWQTPRNIIRDALLGEFEEKNSIIDLSEFNEGNKEFNIHVRKDTYEKIDNNSCLFVLNYDKDDLLKEIEIHNGISVKLNQVLLSFNKELNKILEEFIKLSITFTELIYENYLLQDLKLVIASEESMGGEGNNLGYIYMARDISHLLSP